MRVARAIFIYALAVVVIGALLSPWVYQLVHPHLPRVPFRRVFDRTLLIVALAGLWPLFRRLEIRSWTEAGYPARPGWWRELLTGLALGLGTFAVGGALLVLLGTRQLAGFDHVHWFSAILTGFAVGVLEETFFRGAIFGGLRRGLPVWVAILASSVIYSALHFLKANSTGDADITWTSGFTYLEFITRTSAQRPGVAVGFVTLTLAGIVLAIAYTRTQALYLSIGLHAGWVIALKVFAKLTDPVGRQWWGGGSLVDNMLMWPVLVILGVLLWRRS